MTCFLVRGVVPVLWAPYSSGLLMAAACGPALWVFFVQLLLFYLVWVWAVSATSLFRRWTRNPSCGTMLWVLFFCWKVIYLIICLCPHLFLWVIINVTIFFDINHAYIYIYICKLAIDMWEKSGSIFIFKCVKKSKFLF